MHEPSRLPLVEADSSLRDLAERFGDTAIACVGAAFMGRGADLVRDSATILIYLREFWARRGVDPDEVWTELDHRIQLGQLLLRLEHDARRLPRRRKGQWHPGSTKLP